VLVRDRPQGGIEILLVQRHASMGFMGGLHVFPGGKVCADDSSPNLTALIADGDTDTEDHACERTHPLRHQLLRGARAA
jgi:8-oxo-dGTP pyrophosphatase MutT (NUDIX family)